MEKKKLTTAEIMAKLRAEKAGGQPAAPADSAPPAESPVAAASQEPELPAAVPAKSAPAKTAGGAPKSTKDILAAARAAAAGKAAGGAATTEAAAPNPVAPKPAVAGGAPKGTKDILAAARAQAAGKPPAGEAATATSAEKPGLKAAGKAAAAKDAVVTDGGGERLSVQDMLKAVRTSEGSASGVAEPAAEAKGPIVPKIPVKPAPVAKSPGAKAASGGKGAKKGDAGDRRNFLLAILAAPFALAWALLSATGLIALLGTARFMFPNVVAEPPSKFKVGPVGDYPGGTVSNKWKAMFGIWIVNAEYQGKSLIYALSTVCTHLGCTPNWLDGEQKFKCPCHGSGFYITGVNFEGPAPRPLERFAIRVAEDGMLEVDKSQKFQQEIGQWEDAKSFVEVA